LLRKRKNNPPLTPPKEGNKKGRNTYNFSLLPFGEGWGGENK